MLRVTLINCCPDYLPHKSINSRMDIDPEDVVPSGNPRRRGAVTIGGGVGNKDDTAASGEASTRKMSRKMSSNLKNIWVKMANSSSTKTGFLRNYTFIQLL